ncbi:MAG: flavin reductase family protein [Rhodospirillaceae bacterium]|nr:flavin reductase family protein [Rhodospirillaceae bacterium]
MPEPGEALTVRAASDEENVTNQALNPLVSEGVTAVDPTADDQARREFRRCLGQFATGVTVMTSLTAQGVRVGLTVNSFNSLSLDPPLILWSIANTTPAFKCFQLHDAFAVNVLASGQEGWARQMAQSANDKFQNIGVIEGRRGVPLLEACVAYLECDVWARYPGGDHDIIVGHVKRVLNTGKEPLLFHNGAFRSF